MPNANVFCNTPWYELHIYWDGSFGICCQERHKPYSPRELQYNIAQMTIAEWFNSEPVRNFRLAMFEDKMPPACLRCERDELYGNDSRRLKSNQKSVIFTKTAFDESWKQSPGNKHFQYSVENSGLTTSYPIDLHVDLGNHCNLACKMCNPVASTSIASQEVKWGIESSRKFLKQDWTRDKQVWDNFKHQLLEIPGLNQIHLMGGETLLSPRLEDLVDFMIEHNRFNQCFSFVTNGTQYNYELMQKLSKFKRVGIEISIESLGLSNDYVRQGTDTRKVLENIVKFQQWCNNDNMSIAIRPAPSALTIGSYYTLLNWCLHNLYVIKSNLLLSPDFMQISVLPQSIKQQYIQPYRDIVDRLSDISVNNDFNASDSNNIKQIIKSQAQHCIEALQTAQPVNVDSLLTNLVSYCRKWDKVYNLDARTVYPELAEIWDQYGY